MPVDKWACEFCGELFNTEKDALSHEENCPDRDNIPADRVWRYYTASGTIQARRSRLATPFVEVYSDHGEKVFLNTVDFNKLFRLTGEVE